jgi:hypothetical protein
LPTLETTHCPTVKAAYWDADRRTVRVSNKPTKCNTINAAYSSANYATVIIPD